MTSGFASGSERDFARLNSATIKFASWPRPLTRRGAASGLIGLKDDRRSWRGASRDRKAETTRDASGER